MLGRGLFDSECSCRLILLSSKTFYVEHVYMRRDIMSSPGRCGSKPLYVYIKNLHTGKPLSDLDGGLLLQPICSMDLVHMYIYIYIYTQTRIQVHGKYTHLVGPGPGPAHAGCVYFLCTCIDLCIFVYIQVYQVYRVSGLHQ